MNGDAWLAVILICLITGCTVQSTVETVYAKPTCDATQTKTAMRSALTEWAHTEGAQ